MKVECRLGALLTILTLTACDAPVVTPSAMQHGAAGQHAMTEAQPMQPGQSAFAAISEIVKLLEADSTTDWSSVDIEALREHLIDMDLVTLRSVVRQSRVDGGLSMDVTGDAPVAAAVQRMVTAHAAVLNEMSEWTATVAPTRGGVHLTVTARVPTDSATLRRIRGLGFIGLMVQGDHHTMHHSMIARGGGAHAHGGDDSQPAPASRERDQ